MVKKITAHGVAATYLVEVLLGQAVDGALGVALDLVEPVDELLVLLEELGERHAGRHVLLLRRQVSLRRLRYTGKKQRVNGAQSVNSQWSAVNGRFMSHVQQGEANSWPR